MRGTLWAHRAGFFHWSADQPVSAERDPAAGPCSWMNSPFEALEQGVGGLAWGSSLEAVFSRFPGGKRLEEWSDPLTSELLCPAAIAIPGFASADEDGDYVLDALFEFGGGGLEAVRLAFVPADDEAGEVDAEDAYDRYHQVVASLVEELGGELEDDEEDRSWKRGPVEVRLLRDELLSATLVLRHSPAKPVPPAPGEPVDWWVRARDLLSNLDEGIGPLAWSASEAFVASAGPAARKSTAPSREGRTSVQVRLTDLLPGVPVPVGPYGVELFASFDAGTLVSLTISPTLQSPTLQRRDGRAMDSRRRQDTVGWELWRMDRTALAYRRWVKVVLEALGGSELDPDDPLGPLSWRTGSMVLSLTWWTETSATIEVEPAGRS